MTHPDGTNRPDPAASAPGLTRGGRRGDEGAAPSAMTLNLLTAIGVGELLRLARARPQ